MTTRLAADERLARARALLGGGGRTGIVRPEDAVAACDALRAFVEARYPGARWRREVPVTVVVGDPGARRRVPQDERPPQAGLAVVARDVVLDVVEVAERAR